MKRSAAPLVRLLARAAMLAGAIAVAAPALAAPTPAIGLSALVPITGSAADASAARSTPQLTDPERWSQREFETARDRMVAAPDRAREVAAAVRARMVGYDYRRTADRVRNGVLAYISKTREDIHLGEFTSIGISDEKARELLARAQRQRKPEHDRPLEEQMVEWTGEWRERGADYARNASQEVAFFVAKMRGMPPPLRTQYASNIAAIYASPDLTIEEAVALCMDLRAVMIQGGADAADADRATTAFLWLAEIRTPPRATPTASASPAAAPAPAEDPAQ